MIYKTKPFKHQEDAVRRFVDKPYGALFCEMGTGKTKIVLDIVQNAEEAVDVVQKLLPKKRNLQFTLPPLPTNSPDFRRFSLDPCAESNHLDVPNI